MSLVWVCRRALLRFLVLCHAASTPRVSDVSCCCCCCQMGTGNDGGELLTGTMPAACPDALSVTSIASDDSPSYFSNIARNDSPDNIKAKTVAAPGSSIYSTFNNGGYMTLSGTSMATPHTAGAVAACFLAGDCKLGSLSTSAVIPKIANAAKGSKCRSSAKCGPNWGTSNYYGHAITVSGW